MNPFIGEIIMFGGTFAPRGWADCNGQLLAISSNSALFSILGTTYGGDGRTTFGLPDMRGRVPVHVGQAPGQPTNFRLGQKGGADTTTLITQNLPAHNHGIAAHGGGKGTTVTNDPNGAVMGVAESNIYFAGAGNVLMNNASIQNTGNSQAFNNLQPYCCVRFIIATTGLYPSRN